MNLSLTAFLDLFPPVRQSAMLWYSRKALVYWAPNLGLPSPKNYKTNESLLFINHPIYSILL